MKLSNTSRYAIQAVVYLAAKELDGLLPSHEVARACDLPEPFLLKVLKPLVSAGILQSVRGPGGGYRLGKPAKDITLLDIIEAVDGPIRGQPDFGGAGTDDRLGKKLEAITDRAADAVCREYRKVSVADLVGKGEP